MMNQSLENSFVSKIRIGIILVVFVRILEIMILVLETMILEIGYVNVLISVLANSHCFPLIDIPDLIFIH